MMYQTFAWLILVVSLSAAPALANESLVVCGGEAGSSAIELENATIVRGGNYENVLTLRNSQIIDDFVSKQAIYRGELNSKGEMVFFGLGHFNTPRTSLHGSVNNRHVAFGRNPDGSYTLTIGYTDANFREINLANFTFNDCRPACDLSEVF